MKFRSLLAFYAALYCASAAAAPETYVIDDAHTLPRFSYSHFGYSTQTSRFDKVSGKIVIDLAAHTGSVEVSVDTRSVDTGSALFNQHIQDVDFLDTAHYPEMTFVSDKLIFDGDKLIAVEGVVTLKGISKPINLSVTSFFCMPHPILKKDACGANVKATLKRSDFNLGKYAPHVSDELSLEIPVEAHKE